MLKLETFLPYRLNVLAGAVSEGLARVYADRHGIGIPEWRVIATLGQFERMSGRDIAAHTRLHKTTVSRAVAALEARGLLRRERDRADHRAELLSLKPKGRAMYEDLAPIAQGYAAALLAELPPEDAAALDRAISHLQARVAALA